MPTGPLSLFGKLFDLHGQVAVITGGAGLLGFQHALVLSAYNAHPIILDIDGDKAKAKANEVRAYTGKLCDFLWSDVSHQDSVRAAFDAVSRQYGPVDILVNNVARDPKVTAGGLDETNSRFENFPLTAWDEDLRVGLTSYFLCSKMFGTPMARRGKGVIVNIASDLSVSAPDQRLYRRDGIPDELQPVKPVSYSVLKHGVVGLTKYLATYWASQGVRVNAISPGGVYNNQASQFVRRIEDKIPMARMARVNEIQGTLLWLASDASSYVTGQNIVVDGGRGVW